MKFYNEPGNIIANKLREAAKNIHDLFDWSTTPEGPSTWRDICDKLERVATEATMTPNSMIMNTTTFKILDPSAPPVPAPVTYPLIPEPKVIIITVPCTHIYDNGQCLCGVVKGKPHEWPAGHDRVGPSEANLSNCGVCVSEFLKTGGKV